MLRHRNSVRMLFCLTVLCSASALLAAKGGKPGGGGGGDPPAGSYSMTLLGFLGGGSYCEAWDMNSNGDVVGYAVTADGSRRAFLNYADKDGNRVMVDLNDLITADDQETWVLRYADAINDSGQIVGSGSDIDEEGFSYRYTPGYTDENGSWVLLPVVEAIEFDDGDPTTLDQVSGLRINNRGDVVGSYESVDANYNLVARGMFVFTDATGLIDLGTMFGHHTSWSAPYGINDNMEIVGMAYDGQVHNAFRWTFDGGYEDLGELKACGGVHYGKAVAINQTGQIAGEAMAGCGRGNTSAFGRYHAFRYTKASGLEDLGTFGGNNSHARGMNDAGSIVGIAQVKDGSYRAFLYTDEFGMVDLTPLITNPTEGYPSVNPLRINNAGQICGGGGSNAPRQPILLTPIEQP